VLGGASALGLEIARLFCAEGWRVVSLDYYDASVAACGVNGCALPEDPAAKVSLALPSGAPPGMQMRVAEECLRKAGVVEAAVCVNATLGYATGSVGSDDLFDTIDYAYHTSVQSSVMCAKLAHGFLAPGGLLAMLGSKAALSPQPAMLSFSMGKAAVHQMVRSLALAVGGELPAGATVLALVPEVLDTPLHREMNGGRAASTWTPCDAVASKLLQWATRPETRPPNASFVSVSTSADEAAASKHQFRLIDVPATFVHMTPL
jgi:dihydropteridine reductase